MKKILLPTAYGTRDIIFPEAYNKRNMENTIAEIFTRWGYQEVVTPTYEYLDTFNLGSDRDMDTQSIKFFDRENKTLVLRPDMTTPLARLISTRLYNENNKIHKLFYIANVFRHEQTQSGRQCEFYQAGIEYFGAQTPLADAEIIALAIESIKSTGLTQFKINLGHIDFINGILDDFNDYVNQQVKRLLGLKDVVGFKKFLDTCDFTEDELEIVGNIFFLKGDVNMLQEIRAKIVSKTAIAAIDNLIEIYDLMGAYGLQEYIVFDLSLTRDLQYYSGMVFEAYTNEMGYSLCGGGRYDRMLDKFGLNCPATGFALGIERITLLLNKQGLLQKPANRKALLVWSQETLFKAIKQAAVMQSKGYITTIATHQLSSKEIKQLEQTKSFDEIIIV